MINLASSKLVQAGGVITTCFIFSSLLLVPGCGRQVDATDSPDGLRLAGPTMGTAWHALVWPGNELAADAHPGAVLAEAAGRGVDRVDLLMSTYKPASDLSRFNRSAPNEWVEVDHLTVEVALRSLELAELTAGAFDPTVLPLVDAWSFGPGKRRLQPPSETELISALALVDWRQLEVRRQPPALRKRIRGLQLDFSAIAKGFGADQAADELERSGATALLIEVGGEVVVRGHKPDGSKWQVAIEKPVLDAAFASDSQVIVELAAGTAMATSGDYRNWREIEGQAVAHTIDPRTGKPVNHQLASATVIAADCMTADAIATALMVLGPAAGLELVETMPEVECLLLIRSGEQLEALTSSGFPPSLGD